MNSPLSGMRASVNLRRAAWLLPLFLIAGTAPACGDPVVPPQYAEYHCPAPIGVIVRDDCARVTLKFDGVAAQGGLSAGPVGLQASYRDAVLREADTVVTVLKDQREALCNNYNTCKLTRDDYLREQRRIDTAFTALLGIKTGVVNMDAASATLVMQQIRDIRSGRLEDELVVTTAPTAPQPAASPQGEPQAEWTPGRYMMQAVAGVAEMAVKAMKDSAWGYDKDSSAIMAAFLKTGTNISMTRSFEAGQEYALIAHGSEGSTDVDLGVRDSDGKLIVSDTESDATPVVNFRVPADGHYEVVVQLASAKSSGEFVAVAQLQKGGYDVPSENMTASLSRALRTTNAVHRQHGPLTFHESGNWALFSTVLKPQESTSFGGLLIPSRGSFFLAAADDNAQNIDLFVSGSDSGDTVSDTDADPAPIVFAPARGSERHSAKLANVASRGPAFVTMVVLDRQE